MADGNKLDLSFILISTFIQQSSKPFECGMHPIEDASGGVNTIFCQDGFAYLSPEPPDKLIYPKFDRTITCKASSNNSNDNDNESNKNSNETEKIEDDDNASSKKDDSKEKGENKIQLLEIEQQIIEKLNDDIEFKQEDNYKNEDKIDDENNLDENSKINDKKDSLENGNADNKKDSDENSKIDDKKDSDENGNADEKNDDNENSKIDDKTDDNENSTVNDKSQADGENSKTADKNGDDEDLQSLTNELKQLTEKVADISINDFTLEWGIIEGQNPYLINCDGSTFVYSDELMPFSMYLGQILLFIGYESAIAIDAGQCVTPNKKCIGSQFSVNRSKFEIVQIHKYFQPIINDTNKNSSFSDDVLDADNENNSCTSESASLLSSDAADKLIQYVIKRLKILLPQMMMSNVPCCSHCFRIYSRISLSSPTESIKNSKKPKSKKQNLSYSSSQKVEYQTNPANRYASSGFSESRNSSSKRAANRGKQTLMMTAGGSKSRSQRLASKSDARPRTNETMRTGPLTHSTFEPFHKTPSGLTVIQNVSQNTFKKSCKIYSSNPFPAYLQHQ